MGKIHLFGNKGKFKVFDQGMAKGIRRRTFFTPLKI